MNVLIVVEDDPDIRMLVRFQFSRDTDFELDGEAADVEAAVEMAAAMAPDLIVLDHKLVGTTTGLQGAPLLRAAAPAAKILLFSASEELRIPAANEPAIDAFLLKTEIGRLVALSRSLVGLDT